MNPSPARASIPPNIPGCFEPPAWVAAFIGIPYADEGADVGAGLNCWGFVGHVLRQHFGQPVPLYEGQRWAEDKEQARALARFINAQARESFWTERWRRAAVNERLPVQLDLAPGDVLLLRMDGVPVHVGVVAQAPWFLHTEKATDSALAEMTDPRWVRRIDGVYRFGGQSDDPTEAPRISAA